MNGDGGDSGDTGEKENQGPDLGAGVALAESLVTSENERSRPFARRTRLDPARVRASVASVR